MAGHLIFAMPAFKFASLAFLAAFVTPLALHAAWWLSTDAAQAWSDAEVVRAYALLGAATGEAAQ